MDKKCEDGKHYMFGKLDSVDIDNIKTEGVSMRIGDKIVKLTVASESKITEIDEIKDEYRKKINEQQKTIKQKINEKITELRDYHNSLKNTLSQKEMEIKKLMKDNVPMPEVNFNHAQKGLSVVKGNHSGELIWLVQGIFWPKYIDFVQIEPSYSKRLLSNMIYMINTNHKKVTGVSTRQTIGMSYFEHYHQSSPDCWGKWKFNTSWNKPDDIIKIAREAEAVLENINSGSLADNSPRGLPRFATLKKHLVKDKDDKRIRERKLNLSQTMERTGVTTEPRQESNMWTI